MTDNNLPPYPAGFVPVDEPAPTQTPQSNLPPYPAGFEPVDDQAAPTQTTQQFKTGDLQQKSGGPVVNASTLPPSPQPESKLYQKHPANVLYRDIRSNQSTEQIAGRQQAAQTVDQKLMQPVTTNDVMSQEYQKQHPIQAGLTDLATGMLTPKNIAIMAATDGLGVLAGPESVAASNVARALSVYFTADQIHGVMKESPEFFKAMKEGDASTALRLATNMIGGAGFAAPSAQHAAGVEAAPATRFGEKADRFVDNATNRVKQTFRSDQRAMDVANARHQSAMVEHAQRQREADIAPGQAIQARENAERMQDLYTLGKPMPVPRAGTELHAALASHFGEFMNKLDEGQYNDLESQLQAETAEKQQAGKPLTQEETDLLGRIQKQDEADVQRPPVTKKQVDDANTLASKAAANARKATQALVDSHETLNTAAAEVDRMSRQIEESQSGMSSVTKTVLKKLGLGGLNAEESMVKAGRPNVNSDDAFREALKTAAPALLDATEGVKVKTVGQFEDLLHDTANNLRDNVFNPMIQKNATETIDGTSVGHTIRKAITSQMSEYAPHDAAELADFAEKFDKKMTLRKAESDLQYFNAELKKFYRMNAVDQSAALKTSGTVAKYEAAADGLRDAIYNRLTELGETGHEDAQLQYGALKDLERTFAKRATVHDRQAPLSLHQILTYAGGLGEAAALFLHSPRAAVLAAAPIAVSIASKHLNSPEYLIRSGLKQMRAEMDARDTVPEPPSREFSPLHSELATTYGEDVRDTSYQELESRLGEDIKQIRAKMRRGVPLDTVENNKLAQYGQINAQNAADRIAQQKAADDLAEEKAKLPQANLPIDSQPLMEIPSSRLDAKLTTQKAIVHDMAHHIVADEMGIDMTDGIRSHEHPANKNLPKPALMSAPIDPEQFMDADGNVDPNKLKSNIKGLVATYVAGGVANDLYHGISFDENPHLGADMDILKSFLKKRGLNEAEISKVIAQGVDDAAKILSKPGVREVLEQHASVREGGLSKEYQVSPERMEQIKNDLRGGYETNDTGTVPRQGEQRPTGNGARREGNTEAGAAGKVQQEAKQEKAESGIKPTGSAESTGGTETGARNADITGQIPEESAPIKRPSGGWDGGENPPAAPQMGSAEPEEEEYLAQELQTPRKQAHLVQLFGPEGESRLEEIPAFSPQDAVKIAQKKYPGMTTYSTEGAKPIAASDEYKVPTGKPLSMGKRANPNRTDIHVEKHELGHALNGMREGHVVRGIIRHTNPEAPRGMVAAVGWDYRNSGVTDSNGNLLPEKVPGMVRGFLGGVAADEAFNDYPRQQNHNMDISRRGGDGAVAYELLRRVGMDHATAVAAINMYIDQAKQYLTHPVVSGIINENVGKREPDLSRQYHYSPERLQQMHNEIQRRLQNAGQSIDYGTVGGQGSSGSPENVAPAEATNQGPSAAGVAANQQEIAGLREQTTGDEQADRAIKQAGGVPAGKMFADQPYELTAFHDPQTGSTLNFRKNEPITPETVQAKLAESRKAFGAGELPAAPQLGKPELRVSTRVPQGKGKAAANLEDAMGENRLEIGRETLEKAPEALRQKFADKIRKVPGVKIPKNIQDIGKVFDRATDQLASHLKWLWDRETPENRQNNRKWYESAHNMTQKWADNTGYKHEQIAGALAALSPQTEWDLNVSQAKRLIDIHKNHKDAVVGPDLLKTGQDIIDRSRRGKNKTANEDLEDMLGKIEGKKIGELTGLEQAAAVRLYDETHNPRTFHRIDPATGNEMEVRTNANGSPTRAGWGNFGNMAKALSILDDGSRQNISDQVGDSHKVRNFYNNIIDPSHPRDVTIDTHAVGAATLTPMSGNTKEVGENFGQGGKHAATGIAGTYPLYAEAYRKAAGQLGVKARELQSVTWEKVRDMFPAEWKTKENAAAVRKEWKRYNDGKQGLDETRQNILDMANQGKAEAAERQKLADQKRQQKLDKQAENKYNVAGIEALGVK